jgi:hypothetical protein
MLLMMMELLNHWKKEEDQYEIELFVKDFELILMVLVYEDYYDVMMIDDLIDLYVGMNAEMN